MKTKLAAIIVLFITLLSSGCDTKSTALEQAQNLMGKWYKKKIVFPRNLVLVSNPNKGLKSKEKIFMNNYKIVHYFTADCDKCVDELKTAQQFINKNSNLKVQYIFIACGPTDVYVKQAIKQSKFSLPVYFDEEYYGFKLLNKLPLSDNLYSTMLLDRNDKIILFGDFFGNVKAQKLFTKITGEE